jgi:type I restriction enzyme S subunit
VRYVAYTSTSVPWFPEAPSGWAVSPLHVCASERSESNSNLSERNLLSLSYGKIVRKDIGSNHGLLPESFETYQVIHPGDTVLRLTDLQNDQRSLRSAIVSERGIITSAYLALRPTALDARYLAYQFRSIDLCKVLYSMGGGLRQSIKFADIKHIPLLVPPEAEQRRIAGFLDRETAKIDSLISEQERQVALLQEKRGALISRAVTKGLKPERSVKDSGVPWFRQIPAEWSTATVRRVVSRIEQGWSPQCGSEPANEEEWGVLKAGCVNGGRYRESENKVLPKDLQPIETLEVRSGDLLMSRASGSSKLIGSVALVSSTRHRLMLSDKIYRIHCSPDILPAWFALLFASEPLRRQIEMSISGAEGLANNLPQSALRGFVLAIPPLREQREIVERTSGHLHKLDQHEALAEQAVTLLRERRSALITAAVTGQIDVRGLADAA